MELTCMTVFHFFLCHPFFFFAFQLLPEHRPPTILRPILCLVLCFAPAPSHLSSSMCFLVFLCLDNLEGSISRAFFVILLPAFLIVCPVQVHFLRVIVVFMESCSAMFHNSLLVILSVFPVDVEDSS